MHLRSGCYLAAKASGRAQEGPRAGRYVDSTVHPLGRGERLLTWGRVRSEARELGP